MANKLPKVTKVKIGKNLEFQVVEQPAGRKTFVSEEKDTLTAFSTPARQGIYGFLAHNFLAGKHFLKLKSGSLIEISDQEGKQKKYEVKQVLDFQAKDPHSPRSDFINLKTGKSLSSTALFVKMYSGAHRLVLQTCISKEGNDEWGRRFLIAKPLSKKNVSSKTNRYKNQPV